MDAPEFMRIDLMLRAGRLSGNTHFALHDYGEGISADFENSGATQEAESILSPNCSLLVSWIEL